MKVEDYGIIYTEGTEAVGKYLLGAAGVAAAGYGGYKLYNYLKKKNEKLNKNNHQNNDSSTNNQRTNDTREKIVDQLKIPRWFPMYLTIARNLHPKESENIKLLTEEYLQLSYMSGMEAEEKKENIFKRIWNWIVKQWTRFWNMITGKSSDDPGTKTATNVAKEIEKTEKILSNVDSGIKENKAGLNELNKTKQDATTKIQNRHEEANKRMETALNQIREAQADSDRQHEENQKEFDKMDRMIANLPQIDGGKSNTPIKISFNGYNLGLVHSIISGISSVLATLADILNDEDPLESLKTFKTEREWTDVMRLLSLNKLSKEYISHSEFSTREKALKQLEQEKVSMKKNLTLYRRGVTGATPETMMKILNKETHKNPNVTKEITVALNEVLRVYGHFCKLIHNALTEYKLYQIGSNSGVESMDLLFSL